MIRYIRANALGKHPSKHITWDANKLPAPLLPHAGADVSPLSSPTAADRLSSHHVNVSHVPASPPPHPPSSGQVLTSQPTSNVPQSQRDDVITSSSLSSSGSRQPAAAGSSSKGVDAGATESTAISASLSISRRTGTSKVDPNLMVRDEGWFRCDPKNKECQMTLGSSFIDPVAGQYGRDDLFFLLPVPHTNAHSNRT